MTPTTLNWETFLPALAISYNTSYHSTIASTPFLGEKVRLPSFPNKDIQQLYYGETSAVECFNLLQKLREKAHQFASEHRDKSKQYFDKNSSAHKFKIGDKVLISNEFYMGKNPKLAPAFKGPAKIIDLNDTNAKVKIGNKIKVLNINKLKLFLQQQTCDTDTETQNLNFNDAPRDGPITRARAKLIKFKDTAHLTLLMLSEEGETEINSMCDGPCPSCDTENEYFKCNLLQRNVLEKCTECEKFKKLFLKLKEREDPCHQLKE
jgi:hypothetical protein